MVEPVFTQAAPSVVITRTLSATTIAVPAERDTATICLGGQADFTVSLLPEDVFELMTALLAGEVSYVSCTHLVHGRLLLNARPAGDQPSPPAPKLGKVGPRELSLTLPEQRTCQAVFDSEQAVDLVLRLSAAWELLDKAAPQD
ncbi:hypothetical protein [Kutzneria sp. CA-103260]|uniref:hypothetical protein n=1 Tax=Kutzneria sp. CA-103260 TaxID=2802641 RepID=UPI001BA9833D|nr:hypothetical protein [Kutzneria sp. CA-103260]QUQ68257.1 hypothetical protein JJ691_60020 [Kutzneria sp. CA-103260]